MTKNGKFVIFFAVRQPTRLTSREKQSPLRRLVWIGNSKSDISALPREVKTSFGVRLYELQAGGTPLDMKAVPQFGTGVYELRERFDTNAYRVVYVINLEKAPYVLHAFMKKSKSGISLLRQDAALIEARLQRARALTKGE